MSVENFNPGGVGNQDAGIFGLPHNENEAKIVLIPVPWDVTTSYKAGTHIGPSSILEASPQLDLYHPDFPDLWKAGIFMQEENSWILENNPKLRKDAEAVIEQLSSGKPLEAKREALVKKINECSAQLTAWLKTQSLALMEQGKIVGVVGGDHSVPLGIMQALAEKHGDFSILHFDAHHDYRDAFMGFKESHASIMNNAAGIKQVARLVQVGIRDYSDDERKFVLADSSRLITFYDKDIKEAAFKGKNWHQQCEEIISKLTGKVYISFDIDGLAPHLCPNTGTPVPGGLAFEEAVYLIKLVSQKCKIIGFDLVEVGGDADSIDANIGARLLWNMCGYALSSQR